MALSFADRFNNKESAFKPEGPFRLSKLTRNPIDPFVDYGLPLDGVGASTDEWSDLGLEFETFEAAWAAAAILTTLLPKEDTEWLSPEESDPVIQVIANRKDGPSRVVHQNDYAAVESLVSAWLHALLLAKRAIDEAREPPPSFDF
jgi:hypothetical protein